MQNITDLTPQDKALAGALAMAAKGYRVFPAGGGEDGKKPRLGFMWREGATLDADTIKSWPPFMHYGVAFGSGQFALDLDMKAGKDGVAAINALAAEHGGDLPDTFAVRTSSGGYHLYWTGIGSNSVERIADGIDVRAEGGYCIGAGSLDYEIETDSPVAHAPPWILALVAPKVAEVAKAPDGIVLDDPGNIMRARLRLDATPEAVSGHGGNDRTLKVFNELVRDLGISEKQAVALVEERYNPRCIPPWSHDELVTLAANAGKYGQNEIGAYATAPPSETFAAAILDASPEAIEASPAIAPAEAPEEIQLWLKRFGGSTPSDDVNLPDPAFYDDDKLFQKDPHGYVALIQGKKGAMKTFVALSLLVKLAVEKKLRIAFFAGEGAYGVRTSRLQAIATGLGISLDELSKYWTTYSAAPNLFNETSIKAVIQLLDKTRPDIIVIDTLGQAAPGQDLNSPAFGTELTARTQYIRQRYKCCMILIHHLGKDASKGALGSTMIIADPGTILEVRAVKEHPELRELYVHHVREGAANRRIGYRLHDGLSLHGQKTPVPVRIAEQEINSMVAKAEKPKPHLEEGKWAELGAEVRAIAKVHGLKDTAENSFNDLRMAEAIVALRHAEEPIPEGRDIDLRQNEVTETAEALRRAAGSPKEPGRLRSLCGVGTKPGTESKPMRVWFDPLLELLAEDEE